MIQSDNHLTLKPTAFPNKVKLGVSSMKQLAKALPHLESIDLMGDKAKDADLMAAVEHFGNLQSLQIDTYNATSSGITSAIRSMGHQLLELRLRTNSWFSSKSISASTLKAITSDCPNLKCFAFNNGRCNSAEQETNGLGDAIVALVRTLPHLETLELYNTRDVVEWCHLFEIAEFVADNLDTHALRNIVATGYNRVVGDQGAFDVCEELAEYTFLNVADTGDVHSRKGVLFPYRSYRA